MCVLDGYKNLCDLQNALNRELRFRCAYQHLEHIFRACVVQNSDDHRCCELRELLQRRDELMEQCLRCELELDCDQDVLRALLQT
jgi:hypothetical protein